MVDILMATYNGEKYIENQLLSLIAQTYKSWTLYVHDDGSTDGTLSIIEKYQKIDSRIIIIEDNIIFKSASKNFVHLIKHSKNNYTIFCDQDDIWFESKLESLFLEISKYNHLPCAVFCNGYAYSQNEGIIGNKITNV